MRKRRLPHPDQLRLAFPPEVTDEIITIWRQLKERYPDPIVFIADSGHYISLDTDAETIGHLTGCVFKPASVRCMAIAIDQAATWFGPIVRAGLSVLVCDPPDNPSRFVFT